jgi:hypothetical protein
MELSGGALVVEPAAKLDLLIDVLGDFGDADDGKGHGEGLYIILVPLRAAQVASNDAVS